MADDDRLARLSAQSTREDVAIVEIVYGRRYVCFDITRAQGEGLTAAQLVARCFAKPLADVGFVSQLTTEDDLQRDSSASDTHRS